MNQIIHILKYKLLSYIRLESKFSISYLIKNTGSGLIYAAFTVGAFFFSKNLIRFLIQDIRLGLFLMHELVSIVLFIFFMSVVLGNIIVAYATLFKSNEVNYLITKPIQPTKIFFIKFLDNFFYSSSTLLMILFALLAGYAVYFELSIVSFVFLILNFIPFMLTAGCLGVIVLLILIRLVNIFGVTKVVSGMVIVYLGSIVLYFDSYSPLLLVQTMLKHYPYIDRDTYFSHLLPGFVQFLPNNWLSQSAFWIVKNDFTNSFKFFQIQFALSILLFVIALYLGHRWFFNAWLLNLKITSEFKLRRKEITTFFGFERKSFFRSQVESILKKDILMFVREPSQIIHFLILLLLTIIFISSVSGIKFVGIGNYNLQTIIYLSLTLFKLFFISTLSLRFIYPLISLEGQSFWKLKSSPVKTNTILKTKLVLFSSFILLAGFGLSVLSKTQFGIGLTIFSLIITMFASVTMIAINFGIGGLFANYKEKNAIRLSSSQGATLAFLLNIFYMLFITMLMFKPVSEFLLSRMIHFTFDFISFYKILIPVGVLSSLIIFFSFRLAYKSLQKDF